MRHSDTFHSMPSEREIIRWLNITIGSEHEPLEWLTELRNGVGYLHLMSKLLPHSFQEPKIIAEPTSVEDVIQNFTLLAQVFQNNGMKYIIEIEQLILAEPIDHYRLSAYLYFLFSDPKELECKADRPAKINQDKLARSLNNEINELTEDEMNMENLSYRRCREEMMSVIKSSMKIKFEQSLLKSNNIKSEFLLKNVPISLPIKTQISINNETSYWLSQSILAFTIFVRKRYDSMTYFLFITTFNLLSQKQAYKQLTESQMNVLKGFKGKRKNYQAIRWLFHENKTITSCDQQLENEGTRINGICAKYYRSSQFLQKIVGDILTLVTSKLLFLQYLPKIQQLPYHNFTKKELQLFPQEELCTLRVKYEGSFRIGQSPHKYNPTYPPYWSIHYSVLVSFELIYVNQQAPLLKYQKSPYKCGFMLNCYEEKEIIDDQTIAQLSVGYCHLQELFEEERQPLDEMKRLKEMVKNMLKIKSHWFIHIFLGIYDEIVGEIKLIHQAEVVEEEKRITIVEKIAEKLKKFAISINRMFTRIPQLGNTNYNTEMLLKVTVYCFIAEHFYFHANQLWPIVLPNHLPNQEEQPEDD